jgi:ubiquitin carboxyl-terminal hydrolase 4/11/15
VRSVEVDEDDDGELPPKYSNGLQSGEQRVEGMDIEDSDPGIGMQSNPLSFSNQPAWSFDRATDIHSHSQTAVPPGSYYDDNEESLFDDDDDASNKAVGGGDLSDSELHLGEDNTDFTSMIVDDVPPGSDIEDEELPVVELCVNEDERIVSD